MESMTSQSRVSRAQGSLAGGVGASARLSPVIQRPVYLTRAPGACIETVDGQELCDLNMSLGCCLLGHGHPAVIAAVKQVLEKGVMCSHETALHVDLAEHLCQLIPSAERVRFANTGMEANQIAIRL